jgi:hypothetical protein
VKLETLLSSNPPPLLEEACNSKKVQQLEFGEKKKKNMKQVWKVLLWK